MKCSRKKVIGALLFTSIICLTGCNNDKNTNEEVKVTYNLTADMSSEGVTISDTMYGIFLEDINFTCDGGLYAEMVINRSFEFDESMATKGNLHGYTADDNVSLEVESTDYINENNKNYLKMTNSSGSSAGFTNKGFLEGMAFLEGSKYNFTVYLRSDEYNGSYTINLLDKYGEIIGTGTIEGSDNEWKKYSVDITSLGTTDGGRIEFVMDSDGSAYMDMVSLFPYDTYNNRENGLRADMVEYIKDLEPGFIRFPGGCIVEGTSLETAYNWKDTIGDVSERKQNVDLWDGTTTYPYYQSYGLGFYEYFLLCEDVGATPVPVLNCGMSCLVQSGEFGYADMADDEQMQSYIDDALDLIEFCNGSPDTEYGKIRTDMGHEETFDLKYIAIGNEQWGKDYFDRYEKIALAIKEVYPDMQVITSASAWSDGTIFNNSWSTIKVEDSINDDFTDIVDEHYYNAPEWFLNNVSRYDSYDRDSVKVFLGEYAAKSNTLYAAVAEAAFMTGLEENADVVCMASYAPLFGNVTSSQWTPDLIWFDNDEVYGSVNYYVQKMYSNNVGTHTVDSELDAKVEASALTGMTGLGCFLTSVEYDDYKITDNNTGKVIYESDFESDKDSILDDSTEGIWTIEEDDGNSVIAQTNSTYPTRSDNILGSATYYSDESLTDYTITVRAKKVSGAEGFIIPFAVQDEQNFIHWNIGGWGNTQTCVEQALAGSKTTISDISNMTIKQGEWYDIKIVVGRTEVECYLNDELIHTFTVEGSQDIYETVSIDEETNEAIIKLVNTKDYSVDVNINLENAQTDSDTATLYLLTADSENAANSILLKDYVVTQELELSISGLEFSYEAVPYSVSVIRVPLK